MKKLFKFAFIVALVGGVVYAIRKVVSPPQDNASSGNGVIPSTPPQSLDEAPLGGQISDELLKILVCPEDKGPLELVDDGKFLHNPRNGYNYPIRDGIPVMLIEEGKKFRDTDNEASPNPAVNQNGANPESQESEETVLQQ